MSEFPLFRLFKMVALTVIMFLSTACRSDKPGDSGGGSDEGYVTVGFSFVGDVLEIEGVPMKSPVSRAKALSSTVTAIQIFAKPKLGPNTEFKPYAYGLFDDLASLEVNLTKGYIYDFEVTTVVAAKELISTSNIDNGFRQPFALIGSGGVSMVTNSFTYSGTSYLSGLSQGYSALRGAGITFKLYNRPTTDRYYGTIKNYDPMRTNRVVIDTKRVVFGLEFRVANFYDGEVSVTLQNAPTLTMTPLNFETIKPLFTFQGTPTGNEWTGDSYFESMSITVLWKKSDGTELTIAQKDIQFSRRRLYTIRITLPLEENSNSIEINQEEGGLLPGGTIDL